MSPSLFRRLVRSAGCSKEWTCRRSDQSIRFIQPCSPVTAKTVLAGDHWQHEIKFDGFRIQAHKLGDEVELYSRSVSRFGWRFPLLCKVLHELPVRSAIIDGEVVASDATGIRDFWPLFLRSAKPSQLRVWAFDLLAVNSNDLRKWSLEARSRPPASAREPLRLPSVVALRSIQ
jgi:bifunctional non-homologous end joining protein LigD